MTPNRLAAEIPLRQRLAFRLSANVLVAALLIALVLCLAQIALDYSRVRATQDRVANDILRAHRTAANLAAYNIDNQSAQGIVRGILEYHIVVQASLRSENQELASLARPGYQPEAKQDEAWSARYARYRTELRVDELPDSIGSLDIVLDEKESFRAFWQRAAITLGTGLLFSLLLALVLAWVAHMSVTRQLLRLIGGVQAMDPERPQAELLTQPRGHERSELGLLVAKLHTLIASIAHNIALREQAEQELKRYSEGLETEVAERTLCLARANESLLEALAELKSAQNQLLEAEKFAAIGQLSAGVAHEINNPIAFVAGNIGALRDYFQSLLRLIDNYENLEKSLPPQSATAAIQAVRKEIDLDFLREDAQLLLKECAEGLSRVKAIVADLREYAGEENPHWQRHALDQCLDKALKRISPQLSPEIEVQQRFGDVPEIECLPGQIEQMLEHLLRNAAQALSGRGRISIALQSLDQGVDIAICDTGCGIPPRTPEPCLRSLLHDPPGGPGPGPGAIRGLQHRTPPRRAHPRRIPARQGELLPDLAAPQAAGLAPGGNLKLRLSRRRDTAPARPAGGRSRRAPWRHCAEGGQILDSGLSP